MKAYPHTYSVSAWGSAIGAVPIIARTPGYRNGTAAGIRWTGGMWSPETLLVAAVAKAS